MSISEIYAKLVFEGGLNPKYVLDDLEEYELKPLFEYLYLRNKDDWEQTRMISYVIAQGNSTKKLKPKDLIKFPWDDSEEQHITSISDEDIQRLKDKSKQIINNGK